MSTTLLPSVTNGDPSDPSEIPPLHSCSNPALSKHGAVSASSQGHTDLPDTFSFLQSF